MKFFTQSEIRYALFLCIVLVIMPSYAQYTIANDDFDTGVNSNLTITAGKLLIDYADLPEFNDLNRSSNPTPFNDQELLETGSNGFASNVVTSIISVNLSSGITPTLTTNARATILQRVWSVAENGSNITTVNVRLQENGTRQNALNGNYYMFISNTGVIDATSSYRVMRPDGNGNLETEYEFNGTTYITFGYAPQLRFDRSIYFDGIDDYIDMDNNLSLNPAGFTVSAWVKRDATNSGTVSIVSKRDGAFTKGYDLRILNNNNIEIIWKNGSNQSLISNSALPYDEWHHVSAIYNGSEVSIYIDGVLDNVEDKTSPVTTNESFQIGAAGKNTPVQYFKGNLDEVRIWDVALSENQLRFIMNQEITENSGQVMGHILPTNITKNDINVIPWSALAGYYPMSTFTYTNTNDASGNGIQGALKNINTVDKQTAPLPYLSHQNGAWNTKSTWINGITQYIPGSVSVVDPNITVDWNIVKTSHHVTMDNSSLPVTKEDNRKILGLFIDANELILNGNTNSNEGNGLTVSHYMSLTGKINLEGESQLVQGPQSDLDVTSNGTLEQDQQGAADTYTYKYWSSPVGEIDIAKNDYSYTVKDIMYDGTQPINFLSSGYDGSATNPIGIADYWIWKYANQAGNDYSGWQHVRRTGTISAGEGFTMKGPGTESISTDQNYVFRGKPNNGDINLTIHAGNDYLVGNPYASAIDANQFIIDNSVSNEDSSPAISGTLYFWQHWGGDSHYLSGYRGGYATYNFSGAVAAASYGTNDPLIATGGTPTKLPRKYIPVGQGFFVVGKSTGTINFNNGQRVFRKEVRSGSSFLGDDNASQSQANYNSEENDNRMKFRIGFKSINTIHRQLLLTIDENASTDVDWAYDAKTNENQMDDMYWIINEEAYIIQASDQAESSTVYPIGIKTNTDGLNTITIDALENVPNDVNFYIHDLTLDLYHNLRQSDYEIFLNAGEYLDRFEITFSNNDDSLGIDNETKDHMDILYSNDIDKIILINPNLIKIKSIELFNILGQSVYTIKDVSETAYSKYDVKNLITGTYIIKLFTKTGSVVTKKVLVN
jgi:hypothetical protein